MATGGYVSYDRLIKNENGQWDPESVHNELNRVEGGAANFGEHQMAANMSSRYVIMRVYEKKRPDFTLTQLNMAASDLIPEMSSAKANMELDTKIMQCIMADVGKLIDAGVLNPIDSQVTDDFVEDVMARAARAGVPGKIFLFLCHFKLFCVKEHRMFVNN